MSMGVCSPSPVLAPRVLCLSRVCVGEPRGLKVIGCGAVCLGPDPSLTQVCVPFWWVSVLFWGPQVPIVKPWP